MRVLLVIIGLVVLAVVVLMMLGMINIDQTRAGRLPSVRVEGGQAPEFQTSVGHVDVGTENKVVEVPKVDVQKAPAGQ